MSIFICQHLPCGREYTADNYLAKHWGADDPTNPEDLRDPFYGGFGWFPESGLCFLCWCFELFGGFLEPEDGEPWETIVTCRPCVIRESASASG